MKKISLKKVAILCTVVVMVSMVPIFAAGSNSSTATLSQHQGLKHQYIYHHGIDTDKQVNSSHINCSNDNYSDNCIQNQHKYIYLHQNLHNCTS